MSFNNFTAKYDYKAAMYTTEKPLFQMQSSFLNSIWDGEEWQHNLHPEIKYF